MSKIRVKHFGPIKEGLSNDQFLEMGKVTLLIGNQATGKSSVAKLFSTITWLEKNLYRGDMKVKEVEKNSKFVKTYCAYQGIKDYFNQKTEIEYIGDVYHFIYKNQTLSIDKINKEQIEISSKYLPPKIMYVPAERNFLSIVERPEQLKYLPQPLYTFLDEFERSKTELTSSIDLPINDVRFEYQKQNKISYIKGSDFKLKLSHASSGIQSLLPVFLVSRNLAHSINKNDNKNVKKISIEQDRRLKNRIVNILEDEKLSEEIRSILLEQLSSLYENLCFINIVEEIEQNLFPSSQRDLLNELLKFNNMTNGNKLVLTSHSPYILNYLTIAIKGAEVLKATLSKELSQVIKAKFNQIIPVASCISSKEVKIYEFSNKGEIRLLPDYEGIPSDNNFLNEFLFQTNELFDELLELEEELL